MENLNNQYNKQHINFNGYYDDILNCIKDNETLISGCYLIHDVFNAVDHVVVKSTFNDIFKYSFLFLHGESTITYNR